MRWRQGRRDGAAEHGANPGRKGRRGSVAIGGCWQGRSLAWERFPEVHIAVDNRGRCRRRSKDAAPRRALAGMFPSGYRPVEPSPAEPRASNNDSAALNERVIPITPCRRHVMPSASSSTDAHLLWASAVGANRALEPRPTARLRPSCPPGSNHRRQEPQEAGLDTPPHHTARSQTVTMS